MIKIPIYDIDNTGKEFSNTITQDDLNINIKDIEFDDIYYSIKVSLVSNSILVQGKVSTEIHTKCIKCLDNFDKIIDNRDVCHYYESFTGIELDISDDIKDDLLIKLNDYPKCSKNCQGLCSSCGVNLNKDSCDCKNEMEDDTWNALDNL